MCMASGVLKCLRAVTLLPAMLLYIKPVIRLSSKLEGSGQSWVFGPSVPGCLPHMVALMLLLVSLITSIWFYVWGFILLLC